jgi:hypothetical protein
MRRDFLSFSRFFLNIDLKIINANDIEKKREKEFSHFSIFFLLLLTVKHSVVLNAFKRVPLPLSKKERKNF